MSTTAARPEAASAVPRSTIEPNRIILHNVPWSLYDRLQAADEHRHVRMSYWNGTLELMSPKYIHDKGGTRLERLIDTVTEELDIPCTCSRSTTLKRPGEGDEEGAGKEADTSFYITNVASIIDKDDIDLASMPPPDLAIEVDNTVDSANKLPIYAALGVPEVWRYDVNTRELLFCGLQPDGTYADIDRSECLPMLTPALVLEALALCEGMSESRWGRMLREWVREKLM
jgi:Uma2 family endonuclease